MEISWEQFFELIKKIYDINQKEIAEYLEVDRAVITKLKYNKQQTTRLKKKEIYRKLFDIENSGSIAYKYYPNNPKSALEDLKDGIEEVGLADAIKTLDDSDYKKFVEGLLGLIEKNQFNKPITQSSELERNILQNDMECVSNCSEISVPPECKICLCCENWKGNVKNAYVSNNGVEGKCIMFDKNTLSTERNNCERFNACYNRVFTYLNYSKFKNTYNGIF